MSRIPSIYSLVDPAPYLVDLDEEYDDYDDYEDYRYLQPDDEHLSLPSSPPPLSPQSVSSGSAVEGLRGLDDEEELDAVHGVPYESLSDIDGLSDASIYGGFYDAIPYSLGDGDSDGDSIGESSDLQSQQSSIASPDSDLVSLSLSPSPSTSPSPSPVSAASPSSPASPGSLGYDSVLDSASAADLQLELDLDGSSGSASEPESEPASASSLGAPDRASHQRARRQPQARIIHIHHNRRLPGTHFHLQPPRPDNPPAPPHRNIRANRNALADFSPYNEFTGHQHPRFQARARYFAAHDLDPSENVDILDQFNPHLSSPEVDSINQEDEEDEEDDLPLREHLRFRRARRAIRAAREANRPGGRRSSGAHRRRIPRFEIIWDSDLEEVVEEDHMNNMDIDDELVEVVYQGSVPAPPTPPRRQQRHPRQQRHQHNHNHNHHHHHQHVDVIDLTEEPDSPVLHRHQPVNILRNRPLFRDHDRDHDNPYRNPRRQISQNGRTPSLNRSDGSLLNGNAAAIIDLTMDSPDDNNIPANRRLPPPAPAPVQRDQHNHIFGRNFMGSIRGLLPGLLAYGNIREADIQFIGAAPAIPMNANPLAGNPPDFNYQANGFGGYGGGRQPTPKPDFEAPPAARAGFTRDTGPDKVTDEEQVFVCPSCDNELKYSEEEEEDSGGRSAKKVRTKKDREEHHFWAVKACGHVYCKSCYDNRKKHSKGKDSAAAKTGFQFQPSETARSVKIYCAVDDCESEVSPNNAWVGIFM